MIERWLKLQEADEESVFVWGARQTGKSTLLSALFKGEVYYDCCVPMCSSVFADGRLRYARSLC